jgi:hypothetical protein
MSRQKMVTALAFLFIANLLIPNAVSTQTPPPPIQVSPPNGDTDQSVQVLSFAWNDFTSYPYPATYRVQVSRNSSFTDLILDQNTGDSTGWTLFNLPKNTVYYWRVNLTTRGQISGWSPVWNFQTTNREIPGVPTPVSPAHGATGVPRSPTLTWNAVEGADNYQVDLTPIFSFYTVHGTSVTFSDEALSFGYTDRHLWRVRAVNPAGPSEWSEWWTFTRTP